MMLRCKVVSGTTEKIEEELNKVLAELSEEEIDDDDIRVEIGSGYSKDTGQQKKAYALVIWKEPTPYVDDVVF